MTEEDKYLLEDLNYTFADGFTRGYNRGFLDGIDMLTHIRELLEKVGVETKNET